MKKFKHLWFTGKVQYFWSRIILSQSILLKEKNLSSNHLMFLFMAQQIFAFPPPCQLPSSSLVAQTVKHLPAMWETWVQSLDQEDPLRRKWQPTPVLLPGKSHGWRSLVGYSPWGHKEWHRATSLHFFQAQTTNPINLFCLAKDGI